MSNKRNDSPILKRLQLLQSRKTIVCSHMDPKERAAFLFMGDEPVYGTIVDIAEHNLVTA